MLRKPSIKTLAQCFENPAAARAVFEMTHAELSEHPAGRARIAECYHPPKWWDVRLHVLNSLGSGFHGLESIETVAQNSRGLGSEEYAEYLNTGDTYAPTVIYWRGKYRVQSIGDFVETSRKAFK